MNTHELCTWLQKVETRAEKKLRKAETNLRFSAQPETKIVFANDLRIFSVKNKNSLKFATRTKICGRSSAGILPAGSSPVRLESSSLAMQTISRLLSASPLAGRAGASALLKNLKFNTRQSH